MKVRTVPHIGHTLGFRIEADGQALAYVSDHQAPLDRRTVDQSVLELCDGADLVIHDAQYTDEEFAAVSDWGHSTATYAVARGRRGRGASDWPCSTTTRPTPTSQIDRMLARARELARAAPAARGRPRPPRGSTVDLGRALTVAVRRRRRSRTP